jgi:hypothetical protein
MSEINGLYIQNTSLLHKYSRAGKKSRVPDGNLEHWHNHISDSDAETSAYSKNCEKIDHNTTAQKANVLRLYSKTLCNLNDSTEWWQLIMQQKVAAGTPGMAGAWPPSQNNGLGTDSRGSNLLQNIGYQLFIDCLLFVQVKL